MTVFPFVDIGNPAHSTEHRDSDRTTECQWLNSDVIAISRVGAFHSPTLKSIRTERRPHWLPVESRHRQVLVQAKAFRYNRWQ